MRTSLLSNLAGIMILAALTSCARQAEWTPVWVPAPECVILHGNGDVPDSIRVCLLEPVDFERIPRAGNSSESMSYSHLYETLIVFDCRGQAHPLLSESWSSGDRGRRWRFTLREGARFWDGTPVTSGDIEESWWNHLPETTRNDAGIDSILVEDDRIFYVFFDHRHRKVPGVLAALDFAVTKHSADSPWPLGSGPYRVDRGGPHPSTNTITIVPASGTSRPVIQFLESATSDMRDLIDGMVDMMITADPAVIEYSRNRLPLQTVPLEWDMTYLLLSTSRVQEIRQGSAVGRLPDEITDEIARNAIRGDARGYRPGSWWDDLRACAELSSGNRDAPPLPMGSYAMSGFRRILYDANDPTSRGLAERIVALAATDPSASPEAQAFASAVPMLAGSAHRTIAEGVTPRELASSLKDGEDFAYVISLPRRSTAPCFERHKLLNRARWLAGDGISLSRVLIPIIDTRRHLIVRGDRITLSVDWCGNVRIEEVSIPQER